MIFASTGGATTRSAAHTAAEFLRHGIREVELSGGAPSATLERDLRTLRGDVTFQLHNYFPPPADPFVFNLASDDATVRARSVSHVRTAMRWAVALGLPRYSFHAGFRINPAVAELGRPIGKQALRDRPGALQEFGEQILRLAAEARQEGVTLLIENNVVSASNLATFGEDPLLLAHPEEMAGFMAAMPSEVGLLLDVAHLKVSGRSLGFDPVAAHALVRPWIRGYHLSDNDGLTDSNDPVTDRSWFWDVINPDLDYYSLEVYRLSAADMARHQARVATRLADVSASQRISK